MGLRDTSDPNDYVGAAFRAAFGVSGVWAARFLSESGSAVGRSSRVCPDRAREGRSVHVPRFLYQTEGLPISRLGLPTGQRPRRWGAFGTGEGRGNLRAGQTMGGGWDET